MNRKWVRACGLGMSTLCGGAGVEACLGVAHATAMKVFTSDGGIRASAAEVGADDAIAIDEHIEAWNMTSFNQLKSKG